MGWPRAYARCADLGRAAISLWEQPAAVRTVRARGSHNLSETLLFMAIEEQGRIADRARTEPRKTRPNNNHAIGGISCRNVSASPL